MNIRNVLAGEYTPQQIDTIIAKAKTLPYHEQLELAELLTKYEKYLKVQTCQNKFLDFVKEMWPAFIPGRHHAIMADAFERVAEGKCKRLIINMAPRHALSLDTKIITTKGWKTIAEIEVGDMVFHPDGNPVEVTGVSNVFTDREIYRVSTDDGRYVDVDGEHLWTVRLSRKHGVFHTYSTEDLYKRQSGAILKTKRGGGVYIKETDSDGKSIRNPMLPAVSPLNIQDAELPIDPYMLGVWLGDGHKNNGVITMHDEDQRVLRPIIESKGYKTTDQSTRFTFGVLGLKEKLRSIEVLVDKHIPEQYIMSSPAQKMELVRGLMDTDGNVSKAGQCFFANKNKRIIDSFRIILHSLGIKNSLLEQRVFLDGKDHGLHYKVSFYAKDISKLPRKNDRAVGHTKTIGRYISIKKLNLKSETRCIKVNREDGLFLAGEGMIPTHNTKSEFSSYLLPAWFLGKYPHKKVIQTAHTAELAVGFGRKVRNLVGSQQYQSIFSGVSLSSDSKAAGRWNTNKQGEYFAIGVGGSVTGKGSDLLIIDDPHSEQEAAIAATSPGVYDSVYEWYTSGPRQRLQPGGAIILVMTRWSKKDLCGQILKAASERDGADEWEVIEFPAIMPSGNPLWPEFWPLEELEKIKAELPVAKWNAQYQQNPTSEEGALVKREWWKIWDKDDPPKCEYIIQSWDTALTKGTRSDYSACTTWGVFYDRDSDGKQRANIILLNAYQDKLEFPELKQKALEEYKYWKPDACIIEAKAAGAPLVFELRKMGIPVQDYTPSRGNDKIVRVNAVSDIFASGFVYAPPLRWAEEVIEQFASFPNSDHDDLVDSSTQALLRFRQGGFISTQNDDEEEYVVRAKADYY